MNTASALQTPLPLETGDATILVNTEFVRAIRRCDAESVFAAVDNERHAKHIRFAFDLSLAGSNAHGESNASRRELRYWTTEVLDGPSVAGYTIDEAIAAILGARETFSRGYLEIQWVIGATHIGNLVREKELTETGNRFLRASLINFLKRRWSGGQP